LSFWSVVSADCGAREDVELLLEEPRDLVFRLPELRAREEVDVVLRRELD
jgi:hypothetical protein